MGKRGDEAVPAVVFEDVTVVRGGRTLLRNVSFVVPGSGAGPGVTCAVVGPNGAGKTTILRLIEGYEFPTSGRVEVLGERLGETDLAALRRRVRLVGSAGAGEAGSREFSGEMTLLAVVSTGASGALVRYDTPGSAERRSALSSLRAVGLGGRAEVKWAHASAGERTRTLLARSRMPSPEKGPRLLLLDEPTLALDPGAREKVVRAMARPPRGTSQIVVTHHVEELPPDTAMAVVMKGGRVLAAGQAEKVLTGRVLSRCFGLELRVGRRRERRKGRWSATPR